MIAARTLIPSNNTIWSSFDISPVSYLAAKYDLVVIPPPKQFSLPLGADGLIGICLSKSLLPTLVSIIAELQRSYLKQPGASITAIIRGDENLPLPFSSLEEASLALPKAGHRIVWVRIDGTNETFWHELLLSSPLATRHEFSGNGSLTIDTLLAIPHGRPASASFIRSDVTDEFSVIEFENARIIEYRSKVILKELIVL